MKPSLDIVIVNWNAGPQLRACLASVEANPRRTYTLSRVVVVDNASCDGSATDVALTAVDLVVLENSRNLGFGAACNQGAAACSAEFILFLNPDTVLGEQSLNEPLGFMADPAHAKVGVCGVQLVGSQEHVARSCARFPTLGSLLNYSLRLDRLFPRLFRTFVMNEWPHDSDRVVDHVMGAFYLVRRSVFESLGGFDRRFFVYLEDLDFSKRVYDAGWLVYYLASARVFHEGGGTSSRAKADRLFYSLRSRLQYAFKHLGRISGVLVLACALCVEPFARLFGAAVAGSSGQARDTIRAYALLWRNMPALVRALVRTRRTDAEVGRTAHGRGA